jgi:hypothetical protein
MNGSRMTDRKNDVNRIRLLSNTASHNPSTNFTMLAMIV